MKDFHNIKLRGKLCFYFCLCHMGGDSFEAALSREENDYYLWAYRNATYNCKEIAVEEKKVDRIKAQMLIHKVFPLDKWDIRPNGSLWVDGPGFEIEYHNVGCDISISSLAFNGNAAAEMEWDLINAFLIEEIRY